jgi:hypothetical protein
MLPAPLPRNRPERDKSVSRMYARRGRTDADLFGF